ncbi:MAG TPA: energy transducer TonB [Candidatus Angelobacter sp.]|nr:energy transducer TonB [Candidatus Angelobacter sp.]
MKIDAANDPTTHTGFRFLNWHGMLRLVLVFVLAISTLAGSEQDRKLRSGEPPQYPELARRLNIRGIVRVQVTIAPDGSVKEVKELGGNPVLLLALTSAVKTWKYEAADRTSVLEVKFAFPSE